VPEPAFPRNLPDERELLLEWLGYLREAVLRKVTGITDDQGHWTPQERLIPLLGIVNHLTHVEWRWIDGAMLGHAVHRSDAEFSPGPDLTVARAVAAYRERAAKTDAIVRAHPLDQGSISGESVTLRWVLLHLINETARHAGHADAVRELLDGVIGE